MITPREILGGSVFRDNGWAEVYLLPKALDENVTKLHIPHSIQSSPMATTFSRDEKFKTSPLVSAHPS